MTLGKLFEHTSYTQEIEVRLKDAFDGDLVFTGEAWNFANSTEYQRYAKKRIKILFAYENKLVITLK